MCDFIAGDSCIFGTKLLYWGIEIKILQIKTRHKEHFICKERYCTYDERLLQENAR